MRHCVLAISSIFWIIKYFVKSLFAYLFVLSTRCVLAYFNDIRGSRFVGVKPLGRVCLIAVVTPKYLDRSSFTYAFRVSKARVLSITGMVRSKAFCGFDAGVHCAC